MQDPRDVAKSASLLEALAAYDYSVGAHREAVLAVSGQSAEDPPLGPALVRFAYELVEFCVRILPVLQIDPALRFELSESGNLSRPSRLGATEARVIFTAAGLTARFRLDLDGLESAPAKSDDELLDREPGG